MPQEPPNLDKRLRSGISSIFSKLTTPLAGKQYSIEELVNDPTKQTTSNIFANQVSSPVDLLSNIAPLGKLAVMLPFLRGNKIGQAARLAKMNIGPSDSVAQQAVDTMKNQYRRTLSHTTKSGTRPASPSAFGEMGSGYVGGYGDENFKSEFNLNPLVASTKSKVLAADVTRHEFGHGAQGVSNKKGIPSTKGASWGETYNVANDLVGYPQNPYEMGAKLAGTRGVIENVALGREGWREIPAKMRHAFVESVYFNPEYNRLMGEVRDLTVKGQLTDEMAKQYDDQIVNIIKNQKQNMQNFSKGATPALTDEMNKRLQRKIADKNVKTIADTYDKWLQRQANQGPTQAKFEIGPQTEPSTKILRDVQQGRVPLPNFGGQNVPQSSGAMPFFGGQFQVPPSAAGPSNDMLQELLTKQNALPANDQYLEYLRNSIFARR
jgi:hypothetical protein